MEEVREEVGPNRESRSDGVALGMDGSGGGDDLREEKSEDEADVPHGVPLFPSVSHGADNSIVAAS